MFDVVKGIIDHVWQSSSGYSSTEQQAIYTICGVLIIVFFAFVLDMLRSFVNVHFK